MRLYLMALSHTYKKLTAKKPSCCRHALPGVSEFVPVLARRWLGKAGGSYLEDGNGEQVEVARRGARTP